MKRRIKNSYELIAENIRYQIPMAKRQPSGAATRTETAGINARCGKISQKSGERLLLSERVFDNIIIFDRIYCAKCGFGRNVSDAGAGCPVCFGRDYFTKKFGEIIIEVVDSKEFTTSKSGHCLLCERPFYTQAKRPTPRQYALADFPQVVKIKSFDPAKRRELSRLEKAKNRFQAHLEVWQSLTCDCYREARRQYLAGQAFLRAQSKAARPGHTSPAYISKLQDFEVAESRIRLHSIILRLSSEKFNRAEYRLLRAEKFNLAKFLNILDLAKYEKLILNPSKSMPNFLPAAIPVSKGVRI